MTKKKEEKPLVPFKLPDGITNEVFLSTLERVINNVAHGFEFGYYDIEDIKQEARYEVTKSIHKYDGHRPLDNFIFAVVKSRLINLKRNKFKRQPPCNLCHMGNQHEHEDGQICKNYLNWQKTNSDKANLTQPLDIDDYEFSSASESPVEDIAEHNELMEKIDAELPIELRSIYLRILAGESVSKAQRLKVEKVVREILCQNK